METNRSCMFKFGATLVIIGSATWIYFRFRRSLFSKSVKVGHVSKIMCYPVTSCGAIKEDSAICTKLGLNMLNFTDREYIIGQTSDPITTIQYQSQNLSDIEVFITGEHLILKYRDQPEIKIFVGRQRDRQGCTIQCLGMEIDALDCGNKAAGWLNDCLQKRDLRLFDCKYVWAIESLRFKTVGCTITAESSINEINKSFRFSPPLSVEHFRPNIVISGTTPLDEANWDLIYIGSDAAMEKQASHVQLIPDSFDAKNLEWRHESEPHDALQGAICMPCSFPSPQIGVYATVFRNGRIAVGDPVSVVYKSTFLSTRAANSLTGL